MTKRWLIAAGVGAGVIGIAGFLLIRSLSVSPAGGGNSITKGLAALVGDTKQAIENWCGQQLLAIANAHLRPELSFEKLTYEFPATVVLSNVKLIDKDVTVIDAKSMRIEFTETPKAGRPIVIQTIELTNPVVRLIKQDNGKLVGLSDIIEKPTPEQEKTEQGISLKPSDVFAIRRIGLINGRVSLELPGEPAMMLDQLTFDLTSTPMSDDPTGNGWYAMDAHFGRPGTFDWKIESRLNIDTAMLDIHQTSWAMKLSPEHYGVLPPELQKFVRDHEMTGDLAVKFSGTLSLQDFAASNLDVQALLTGGHMVIGEYVLPVQSLDLSAHLSSGTLTVKPFVLASLGGTVELDGTLKLSENYPVTMTVDAKGLRIEEALKPTTNGPPKFAGRVDLGGLVGGQLRSLETTANGTGRLNISEGRLMRIPAIASINRVVVGEEAAEAATDHGTADFQIFGDHVGFTNIDMISGAVTVRGEGEVMFNSAINFRINAGPLAKVESNLGSIGELIGKVADKLVRYEVTGTLNDPVVTVKPLGLDLGIGK